MTREELFAPLFAELGAVDLSLFDDWEAIPGFIDGQHAATALVKGTEIHFGIMPAFRRKTVLRGRTQEFLRPMFERRGYLTTRVQLASQDKKTFVERVGFKPTWADETFQYYLLGSLPFARR
jgi:hypothetical protein